MHYLLLGMAILLHSFGYSQDLSTTNVVEGKEQNILLPLGKNLLFTTFKPYKKTRTIANNISKWKLETGKEQQEYKVSLIGINVNSWLENPEYFNVLEKETKKFPVTALLDNLQANNPNLIFNTPDVVSKVLKTDIYSPYLNIISNNKPISLFFSDINKIISYTRRYHIYGVAAGNLPYFGRPVEGGGRAINLAFSKDQIDEMAVKLPETDIFLVAMINVIPNWLEEGLDIFHISQQRMEVLVYAFNRKGKLLGGAGVPMKFINNGKSFVMEQQIVSKIWQSGISRQFYILPSFNLLNTENKKEAPRSSDIIVPIDKYPTLNRNQRYILRAINQRREDKLPIEVQLFTTNGDQTLELRKLVNSEKIVLANKTLVHKDTKLLNQTLGNINSIPMRLTYNNIMVRLQNQKIKNNTEVLSNQKRLYTINPRTGDLEESNISLSERTLLLKEYYPSNEGDKLESLLTYTSESLLITPVTHSNKLYYTNEVRLYELETDPILYRQKEKKYVFLRHTINDYKKEYNKETKKIIKNEKLTQKDQIFWFKYLMDRLEKQNLSSIISKESFSSWLRNYKKMGKENLKKITLERKQNLYYSLNEEFYKFENRNMMYLNENYIDDPRKLTKKLEQLAKQEEKQQQLIQDKLQDEKMKERYVLSERLYEESLIKEKESRAIMLKSIPNNINYMKEIEGEETNFFDISLIAQKQADLVKDIARQNSISPELVSVAFYEDRLPPSRKKYLKMQKREIKRQERETRRFLYEGFVLGLTSNWATRTRLKDRLEQL